MTEEPILLARYFNKSALFSGFITHHVSHPQFSGFSNTLVALLRLNWWGFLVARWFKNPALSLQWLVFWCRFDPAPVLVQVRSLAQELPHAMGMAKKTF